MATFVFSGGFRLEAATTVRVDGVVLSAIHGQRISAATGALACAIVADIVCRAGIIVIAGQGVGCVYTAGVGVTGVVCAGIEVIAILLSRGGAFMERIALVSIGAGISV